MRFGSLFGGRRRYFEVTFGQLNCIFFGVVIGSRWSRSIGTGKVHEVLLELFIALHAVVINI